MTTRLDALKTLLRTGLGFVKAEWELTGETEHGSEEANDRLLILYATHKPTGEKYTMVITRDRREPGPPG